jgi:hypothetical protein
VSVFNPIGSIKSFLNQLDATDAAQLRKVTLAYIAFHAVFWFFIAIVSHTAPHKDSIEELFWLQHFDWGYPKFGPIGTWWVHLFVVVFGRAAAIRAGEIVNPKERNADLNRAEVDKCLARFDATRHANDSGRA